MSLFTTICSLSTSCVSVATAVLRKLRSGWFLDESPFCTSFPILWKPCVRPTLQLCHSYCCSPHEPRVFVVAVPSSMASFGERVEDSPLANHLPEERLQLHVRCVPDEDKVQLYLALRDGSTVTLNRYVKSQECTRASYVWISYVPCRYAAAAALCQAYEV